MFSDTVTTLSDLTYAQQALQRSASIEEMDAPTASDGFGFIPDQEHDEKEREAEEETIVVDTALSTLDLPFMQTDKVSVDCNSIECYSLHASLILQLHA